MNYLLEFTVCTAVFYGLYLLIFSRLTFIRLNRIYLLSSLVISLCIPLISYQWEETVLINEPIVETSANDIFTPLLLPKDLSQLSEISTTEKSFDWMMLLQIIYGSGVIFMFGKLVSFLIKILKMSRLRSSNGYISTQGIFANSSFFNLIFIDDSTLSEPEIEQIIAHERWHIRLYHSYDLLFVEIVKIAFWFNPVIWLLQKSLSQVHEYEADTRMVQAYHPQTYATLLLKLANTTPRFSPIHQFSRKPLTDRIHFLFTKQKSTPMKRLAYLFVLPILGAIFMAFSVEKVVKYQEIEESSKYFKIVRGEKIKIVESDMSQLSILRLMNEEVRLLIGFNKLSNESINAAKSYFKDYGFNLEIIDSEVDSKGKLKTLEISLLEQNKIEKEKNRKRSYAIYNDGGRFDLDEYRNLSKKDKGLFLSISANKTTGIHTVSLANMTTVPPVPPLAPLPPKAPLVPPTPPKAPVKVGLKKGKKEDFIHQSYIIDETNKFKDIDIASNNSSPGFQGKRIDKNIFLSKIITQKDWQVFLDFVNKNTSFSSKLKKEMIPDYWDKVTVISDKLPVKFVSFDQATEYCKWRTKLLNQNPLLIHKVGYPLSVYSKINFKLRLPTEKEWNTVIEKKVISSNNFGFRCILEMSVSDHKKAS